MKSFSTAELTRKIGDVTHAASEAPVSITQHNKPRFVLMSEETFRRYETLNPQRAYRVDEIPGEITEWLVPALENFARGQGGYDD
jgi:prevent-host-death family protein